MGEKKKREKLLYVVLLTLVLSTRPKKTKKKNICFSNTLYWEHVQLCSHALAHPVRPQWEKFNSVIITPIAFISNALKIGWPPTTSTSLCPCHQLLGFQSGCYWHTPIVHKKINIISIEKTRWLDLNQIFHHSSCSIFFNRSPNRFKSYTRVNYTPWKIQWCTLYSSLSQKKLLDAWLNFYKSNCDWS